MDMPITERTTLVSLAEYYLLAQGEYSPPSARVQEIVGVIKVLNADKICGEQTKAGPGVIRIPDPTVPVKLKGGEDLTVMGLSSQYGLGEFTEKTKDHGVVTLSYRNGSISLYANSILEVRTGAITIPGDVVQQARAIGNFQTKNDSQGGGTFYYYKKGYIELLDRDNRTPQLDKQQRKEWVGRTLVVGVGDKTTTVYSLSQGRKATCSDDAEHQPVCRVTYR